MAEGGRTPVTIISGFLGSGKTTLLKHLLENTEDLKIALIVNDMAELNIDAALVRKKGAELSKMEGEDGKMVELDNGCICCSLKPNMVKEVSRLSKAAKFDYIVIESSGICEPMPIAQVFFEDQDDTEDEAHERSNFGTQKALEMLGDLARLDTMVTVVDATRFWENINSLKTIIEHYGKDKISDTEEGRRSIAELLVDQVEFANVILINKADLMDKDKKQFKQVKDIVKALNPDAVLLETTYSKVKPSQVLSTGLFDLEKARMGSGWARALQEEEEAAADEKESSSTTNTTNMKKKKKKKKIKEDDEGPNNAKESIHHHRHHHHHHQQQQQQQQQQQHNHHHGDHYGIKSFIYRRRRPFHPQRLFGLLDAKKGINGSLRSKGFCWMASRHSVSIEWNMAGKICNLESGGMWYAEDSEWKEEFADEPEILKKISADFQDPWGDRRIELVIIGVDMDQEAIEKELDVCLLNDKEMKAGPEAWGKYVDTFPAFDGDDSEDDADE